MSSSLGVSLEFVLPFDWEFIFTSYFIRICLLTPPDPWISKKREGSIAIEWTGKSDNDTAKDETAESYQQSKLGRRLEFIIERKVLVIVMPLILLEDGGVGTKFGLKLISIVGMESRTTFDLLLGLIVGSGL